MPHYKDIQTQIINLAAQDEGDEFEDMTKAAINRVYRRCLQAISADEQKREFSLTTRANVSQYGMPLYVKQVLNIEDATNARRIYDISAKQFDVDVPGNTTTGAPWKAYPLGVYGVQRQPATALTLKVSSSSASDVTNYFVRITGYVSGVLTTERLTLTGTTQVTTTNTWDANGIESITKIATSGYSWNGSLTVTDGTNTLSTIPVWYDSPRYLWYEFYPIPDSALTYTVRAIMRKPDLLNDEDWPDIDEDFHSLLVNGALMELLPAVGKSAQGQAAMMSFERDYRDFKTIHGRRPNKVTTFGDVQSETTVVGIRRPQVEGVDYA